MCNRPPEGVELNVVREAPAAVDLHHRKPLPVGLLQRRVAGDVHLSQCESQLLTQASDLCKRALAEMATGRVVDEDGGVRGRAHA